MTILIMFLPSTLSCLMPNIISFVVVVYPALFLAFICCFGNIYIFLNILTLNGSQETRASLLVGIFSGIGSNQKMKQMFEKPMFMFLHIYKYITLQVIVCSDTLVYLIYNYTTTTSTNWEGNLRETSVVHSLIHVYCYYKFSGTE